MQLTRWAWAAIVLFQFLDLLTTHIGFQRLGFREINPFTRFLLNQWGTIGLAVGKAIAVVAIFLLATRLWENYYLYRLALVMVIVVSASPVFFNIRQMVIYWSLYC